MDIKNIVENSILKHLLTKDMPDEITISCTSKIDNHKYGIVTTVEELAGEIADDIKKELKLAIKFRVTLGINMWRIIGQACWDIVKNKHNKYIKIYIEEIDDKGKHQEG